jgi:Ca2+-binding EF-hand superfamily protein
MKSAAMISAVLLLAVTSAAHAEGKKSDSKPEGSERFAKHDKNGDGKVTAAELLARAEVRFREMDTNGDGKVVPAERNKYQEHEELSYFAKHDSNSDGKLSRQEVPKMSGDGFKKRDDNDDGALTRKEVVTHALKKHHWYEAEKEDATLTRGELKSLCDKRLKKLDKNDDGSLSLEEFKKKSDESQDDDD